MARKTKTLTIKVIYAMFTSSVVSNMSYGENVAVKEHIEKEVI